MKFPKASADRHYKVSIPKMDGGVDLSVGLSQVRDNQLTDVKNMYWNNGSLRPRLGIKAVTNSVQEIEPNGYYNSTNNYFSRVPSYFRAPWFSDGYGEWLADIYVENIDSSVDEVPYGGSSCMASLIKADGQILDMDTDPTFGVGSDAYFGYPGLFIPASTDSKYTAYYIGAANRISGLKNGAWELVYPYIPLVLINGNPFASATSGGISGQQYEGYNLLAKALRATYNPDGTGKYYYLPKKDIRGYVRCKYTKPDGTILEFEITQQSDASNTAGGLKVYINRVSGVIEFQNSAGTIQTLPADGVENTVEFTANIDPSTWEDFPEIEPSVIGKMQFCTWFGGDRSGINGGTRLFVSGNPDEPNLVHWSDLNNPLYFPENNFSTVGDGSQKVTAFSKQNDMLIIFKEHEIYFTNYASNNFTAEEVMSGAVIDVASSSAKFPLTQIHSLIGCDCPNTIRLCANRLVWATTDKKVYTLVGTNNFSERNIFELSIPIEIKLKKEKFLYFACACDWNGYYILFTENKAYALQYNSNSFAYISSYADTEKSQKALSWYLWEFPDLSIKYAVSDGENCCLVSEYLVINQETGFGRRYRASYVLAEDTDEYFVPVQPRKITAEYSSPDLLASVNHNLLVGDAIVFSGNLQPDIPDDFPNDETRIYYIVSATTDYFAVSATKGGVPITFSSFEYLVEIYKINQPYLI